MPPRHSLLSHMSRTQKSPPLRRISHRCPIHAFSVCGSKIYSQVLSFMLLSPSGSSLYGCKDCYFFFSKPLYITQKSNGFLKICQPVFSFQKIFQKTMNLMFSSPTRQQKILASQMLAVGLFNFNVRTNDFLPSLRS